MIMIQRVRRMMSVHGNVELDRKARLRWRREVGFGFSLDELEMKGASSSILELESLSSILVYSKRSLQQGIEGRRETRDLEFTSTFVPRLSLKWSIDKPYVLLAVRIQFALVWKSPIVLRGLRIVKSRNRNRYCRICNNDPRRIRKTS